MLSITFNGHHPASPDAGGLTVRQQLDHAFEALGFTRGLHVPAAPAVSVSSADNNPNHQFEHDEAIPTDLVYGDKAAQSTPEQAEAPKPRRGRPPKAAEPEKAPETPAPAIVQTLGIQPEPAPQISVSPEDRKPPEEPAAAPTHDDVRQAIGAYGQKFGDEVAVKNGRTFMGLLPGQKIPEIPADRIAAVVAALRGAIASGKPEPASAVDDLG